MRKMLRAFLNFLDKRFPEKVMVTQESFKNLVDAQMTSAMKIAELQGRVGQLETGVRNISMQMGFGGKVPGEFNLER